LAAAGALTYGNITNNQQDDTDQKDPLHGSLFLV
jgi:hypothetical protein